jgi:hypothetical protein
MFHASESNSFVLQHGGHRSTRDPPTTERKHTVRTVGKLPEEEYREEEEEEEEVVIVVE